jgi:hypothetical protein
MSNQKTYVLTFQGRKKGAIGVMHPVRIEVKADSAEAAALKAYDTHDHVMWLKVVEKGSP